MDNQEYTLLKDSFKKIMSKSFLDYKKQHAGNAIYGIALCLDIFETRISLGIITGEHLVGYMGYSEEELKEHIFDCDYNYYIAEGIAEGDVWSDIDKWCTIIENGELTSFNKTLEEKLPFPSLPIYGEADYEVFVNRNIELVMLPLDVLDELHQEQFFKEFGDNFALLYVGTNGRGSFVGDIKDELFEYELSGWRRDVLISFYDENEELKEDLS